MEKVKVCVIDGTNIAQLAKVISEDQKFDICIIEEHPYEGISKTKGFAVCRDIIAYQIKTMSIYAFLVPTVHNIQIRNFLDWYKLWKIKQIVYQVFNCIGGDLSNCRFYGAITSTIMNFLPDGTDIVQLDHGVECVERYIGRYQNNSKWKLKKRKILQCFTGFYPLPWRNVHTGYTFANCKNDWFINIDYRNFENKYFKGVISSANEFYKGKKIALVLLESQGAYEEAMRINGREGYIRKLEYEKMFRSMIKKVGTVDEVIVKFHPVTYMGYMNEIRDILRLLKNICGEFHIGCVDVTELYDSMIAPYISAEFYVNYLPVTMIVAPMSTTVLNVSNITSRVKSICYSDFMYKLFDEGVDNINNINKYIEVVNIYEKED